MKYVWPRVALIVGAATIAPLFSYLVLSDPHSPRWLVALTGFTIVGSVAAIGFLFLFAWVVWDDLSPKVKFGAPKMPLMLATKQAAFVGQQAYTTHPVKFWAGVAFGSNCVIGILRFDKPGRLSFSDPATPTKDTDHG